MTSKPTRSTLTKRDAKQQHRDEQVNRLGKGEYEAFNKYLNDDTYMTFRHLKCQRTFSATLSQFKKGARCPSCSSHACPPQLTDES